MLDCHTIVTIKSTKLSDTYSFTSFKNQKNKDNDIYLLTALCLSFFFVLRFRSLQQTNKQREKKIKNSANDICENPY